MSVAPIVATAQEIPSDVRHFVCLKRQRTTQQWEVAGIYRKEDEAIAALVGLRTTSSATYDSVRYMTVDLPIDIEANDA